MIKNELIVVKLAASLPLDILFGLLFSLPRVLAKRMEIICRRLVIATQHHGISLRS